MFPNEGPYRCILAGCPKGRIVLDPFSGLATTGIEAIRLGCNYIGVDLPPENTLIFPAGLCMGIEANPTCLRGEPLGTPKILR